MAVGAGSEPALCACAPDRKAQTELRGCECAGCRGVLVRVLCLVDPGLSAGRRFFKSCVVHPPPNRPYIK